MNKVSTRCQFNQNVDINGKLVQYLIYETGSSSAHAYYVTNGVLRTLNINYNTKKLDV